MICIKEKKSLFASVSDKDFVVSDVVANESSRLDRLDRFDNCALNL